MAPVGPWWHGERMRDDQGVAALPEADQQRLPGLARGSASGTSDGVAGRVLLPFAGSVDRDDVAAMAHAIDEECERVDPDAW